MAESTDFVVLDDGPLIDPDRLEHVLGWSLKPQGLCKDEHCVIVGDPDAIRSGDQLDVTAVAALLDRPAVHDEASSMVAIGAPRAQRRGAIDDLRAPDFTLPDLQGTEHRFADHRSKKKLLVAFSSW